MAKDMIQVMRLSFPDEQMDDLIASSIKDLPQQLEVMWGEGESWKNFRLGTKFVITFEEMSVEAFNALEEWEA